MSKDLQDDKKLQQKVQDLPVFNLSSDFEDKVMAAQLKEKVESIKGQNSKNTLSKILNSLYEFIFRERSFAQVYTIPIVCLGIFMIAPIHIPKHGELHINGEDIKLANKSFISSSGATEDSLDINYDVNLIGDPHINHQHGFAEYTSPIGEKIIIQTPFGQILAKGADFTLNIVDFVQNKQQRSKLQIEVYSGELTMHNRSLETPFNLHSGQKWDSSVRKIEAIGHLRFEQNVVELKKQFEQLQSKYDRLLADKINLSNDFESISKTLKNKIKNEQKQQYGKGDELPFPIDLPNQYKTLNFSKNIAKAMFESDFNGKFLAINCSSYPCIMKIQIHEKDLYKQKKQLADLQENLFKSYPEEHNNVRFTRNTSTSDTVFDELYIVINTENYSPQYSYNNTRISIENRIYDESQYQEISFSKIKQK